MNQTRSIRQRTQTFLYHLDQRCKFVGVRWQANLQSTITLVTDASFFHTELKTRRPLLGDIRAFCTAIHGHQQHPTYFVVELYRKNAFVHKYILLNYNYLVYSYNKHGSRVHDKRFSVEVRKNALPQCVFLPYTGFITFYEKRYWKQVDLNYNLKRRYATLYAYTHKMKNWNIDPVRKDPATAKLSVNENYFVSNKANDPWPQNV